MTTRTRTGGRAADITNITNTVGTWQAHRRTSGDSLAPAVRALLAKVDLDRVASRALLDAFRALLEGLPSDNLAEVSGVADAERTLLAECLGDRELELDVTDAQLAARMRPADLAVVRVLQDGVIRRVEARDRQRRIPVLAVLAEVG